MRSGSRITIKQTVALLVAAALLAGCRAPAPSFDPFAAYGPRRVPPPATGSYGRPDAYYQPPATTQPPAAAPFSTPPGARPLPATPPPSLGTQPPGTTNMIPPPVAPTKWQPSDSDEGVDVAGNTASSPASDDPVGGLANLNVRKNDRLIWNSPDKAIGHEIRPASAAEPLSPSSNGSTERPIASFAPQLGSDVTLQGNGIRGRSASAMTPPPQPFTPREPLTEITQLPTPTYLPNNFRPLAVRRSPSNARNAAAPSTATYGVAPASADECLCLPPDRAIGSGVVTTPALSIPHVSTAQGADVNSVLRDNNRGPATARAPAVEHWKSR